MNITITQEILNGKLQQAFNYGVNEGKIKSHQEYYQKAYDEGFLKGKEFGQKNPSEEIILYYKNLGREIGYSEGWKEALKGTQLPD